MGTKVHCESLFHGHNHHSMRDLNNESNGCRWPLFYADNKASANDQFYNDKDVVLELHRVYKIQKDLMDELKRKQFNKEWVQNEVSCSAIMQDVDTDKDGIISYEEFCSDDESWDGLEESIETVFEGKVQQFEPQVNERWHIAIRRRDMRKNGVSFKSIVNYMLHVILDKTTSSI